MVRLQMLLFKYSALFSLNKCDEFLKEMRYDILGGIIIMSLYFSI